MPMAAKSLQETLGFRQSLMPSCPQRAVTKIGSGRSPETLEYEKMPFAMLLRYCGLNDPYAACRLSGQAINRIPQCFAASRSNVFV
jgi:hypothetical protein